VVKPVIKPVVKTVVKPVVKPVVPPRTQLFNRSLQELPACSRHGAGLGKHCTTVVWRQ
jgi:hypothetical protein